MTRETVKELNKLRRFKHEMTIQYDELAIQYGKLEQRLEMEMRITDQYRQFFAKNPDYCNWMRDHDRQFRAFKNSPYYLPLARLSPVGDLDDT